MNINKTAMIKIACLLLILFPLAACSSLSTGAQEKPTVKRIGPSETRDLVQTGEALLVCSYDDQTCEKIMLEGALFKSELEARESKLPKDSKIIFY